MLSRYISLVPRCWSDFLDTVRAGLVLSDKALLHGIGVLQRGYCERISKGCVSNADHLLYPTDSDTAKPPICMQPSMIHSAEYCFFYSRWQGHKGDTARLVWATSKASDHKQG